VPMLPWCRRSPALGLAALAAAAQGADVEGIHVSHHDWELACDNTRSCRAAGYQADDAEFPVSVLLTREGGPGTPLAGQLQLGSLAGDPPGAQGDRLPLQLAIDGQVVGAVEVPLGSLIAELPAPLTAALLKALPGNATLRFLGSARTWELSNRGAAAVLLKMDEFQGRLGTPGAVLRKGEGDEAAVPSAVAVPQVQAVTIDGRAMPELAADATLRPALLATAGEACAADLMADGELSVERIDSARALASLPCWQGAYNYASAYWIIAAAAPFRPTLVSGSISAREASQLIAAHKGRGIGDCWSQQTWTWDGTRFVPSSASTTGQCKQLAAGGDWELPTLVTGVIAPRSGQ
jgi:hypothetical protein